MNYYIQGNTANADKIKAAFEKLGIDVLDFGFADKTVMYCSIGGIYHRRNETSATQS